MKNKFMNSKLGKWIKRIVVILIAVGLIVFGMFKLFDNKTNNVEKSSLETLEKLVEQKYRNRVMCMHLEDETNLEEIKKLGFNTSR